MVRGEEDSQLSVEILKQTNSRQKVPQGVNSLAERCGKLFFVSSFFFTDPGVKRTPPTEKH